MSSFYKRCFDLTTAGAAAEFVELASDNWQLTPRGSTTADTTST